jgi:hypothetical protein
MIRMPLCIAADLFPIQSSYRQFLLCRIFHKEFPVEILLFSAIAINKITHKEAINHTTNSSAREHFFGKLFRQLQSGKIFMNE